MTESSHIHRRPASIDVRILALAAMTFAGPSGLGCGDDKTSVQSGSQAPVAPPGSAVAPASSDGYGRDIDKICDVVERAGARELAASDRTYVVAMWLGENLETSEARGFLAKIQPLAGPAKAQSLEAEAKRVGLARCALADEWR